MRALIARLIAFLLRLLAWPQLARPQLLRWIGTPDSPARFRAALSVWLTTNPQTKGVCKGGPKLTTKTYMRRAGTRSALLYQQHRAEFWIVALIPALHLANAAGLLIIPGG